MAQIHSGAEQAGEGRLVDNLMHFARTLRAAGLAVGPGQVIDAINAVEGAGLSRRDDFYWTLHAVFVKRRDQREIFDQAFHVFWRNPRLLEKILGMMLQTVPTEAPPENKLELSRRVSEALRPQLDSGKGEQREPPELEIDARLTFSDRELLQKKDFEQMSQKEIEAALAAVHRMRLPLDEIRMRRHKQSARGARIDMRATMQRSLRRGGFVELRKRTPRLRRPPLVVLCDISGSMSRYTRMFLHFMHTLMTDRDRVFCFVFGTRLTNLTRHLRNKDVDIALAKAADSVEDWAGGTRIGHCLHDFNVHWGRRVLGQGAVVLLISDGLDREIGTELGREMERLHKSCRRLIWLNPLLRFEGYEPKSHGNKAMLPHVDDFRTVHNLDSLADLARALSAPEGRRGAGMASWRDKLASVA